MKNVEKIDLLWDVVWPMVQIVNDPKADDDERQAAINTLDDALLPIVTNGKYGVSMAKKEWLRMWKELS